jgi:uncharacterized protein (DUF2267 family)
VAPSHTLTIVSEYVLFLEQVKRRANLENGAAAAPLVRATLETLAECLEPHCAARVAVHLPRELRAFLLPTTEKAEPISVKMFLERVSMREKSDASSALFRARCVLQTLMDALPASDVSELRGALPQEFGALFVAPENPDLRIHNPEPGLRKSGA